MPCTERKSNQYANWATQKKKREIIFVSLLTRRKLRHIFSSPLGRIPVAAVAIRNQRLHLTAASVQSELRGFVVVTLRDHKWASRHRFWCSVKNLPTRPLGSSQKPNPLSSLCFPEEEPLIPEETFFCVVKFGSGHFFFRISLCWIRFFRAKYTTKDFKIFLI